ncbi:hypothetical protein MtrunA17_Chr8g0360381 [Medicago truncatula]|uniref:Uncharacterized protein n=1 Tax=Medicago truncatula TaxID=3880 RepID=A0A396GKJ9_MEDTR|nr:hypothetical protein MtrunA17_Chr8g0360381 [Medicago truncatula]
MQVSLSSSNPKCFSNSKTEHQRQGLRNTPESSKELQTNHCYPMVQLN